jgi:excisionase family DNA binding protein
MKQEKYYSPNEIAEIYNVKEDTVRKWISMGRLKAIKMGRLWRIPESALLEFIKSNQEKEK